MHSRLMCGKANACINCTCTYSVHVIRHPAFSGRHKNCRCGDILTTLLPIHLGVSPTSMPDSTSSSVCVQRCEGNVIKASVITSALSLNIPTGGSSLTMPYTEGALLNSSFYRCLYRSQHPVFRHGPRDMRNKEIREKPKGTKSQEK